MAKKTIIKVVIFDMGGVTIKWTEDAVYKHISKITCLDEKKIKKIADHYMKQFDKGEVTESEFWRLIADKLGYKKGLKGNWLANYGAKAIRNEAVYNTIKKIRESGYRVATISNVIRPHYEYNVKHGLYDVFQEVYASCNMKMRKPEKQAYVYAVKKLHVQPKECLFVDNWAENVRAAKKCGMRSFVFKNAGQMKKELKKEGIRF